MNILTHILGVLVVGKILNLTSPEWILAFIFGVLIDIDHLVKLPLYIKHIKRRHPHTRTPLQEPVSYLWIIPLSIFLNSYVPVVFFTLHVILDYLMSYGKKPFFPFSSLEIKGTRRFSRDTVVQVLVSVALCIFLIVLLA